MSGTASTATVLLNNGERMPILGLGTWKSAAGQVRQAVAEAIDAGYRHIDGAHVYQNEHEVGAAINAKIADGTVRRSELFVTGKLWCTDHRPERVRAALLHTLNTLNTPYLDLYLMHLPCGLTYADGGELFPNIVSAAGDESALAFDDDVDYLDTWRAMELAVDDGLVRSIGVSNFNRAQTERLLAACRIRPVTNQIEAHPYLTQSRMLHYLRSVDLTMTGYSPLGSPDRPWATASDEPPLLQHPRLQQLADKYGKTVAQILIRYQIDRGVVVIPKSVTPARIRSNMAVFDFRLTAEDVAVIDGFDCGGRLVPMQK